jgi:hypothetical protein
MFDSILEAVEAAERDGISLGELAIRREAEAGLRTREEVVRFPDWLAGTPRSSRPATVHCPEPPLSPRWLQHSQCRK